MVPLEDEQVISTPKDRSRITLWRRIIFVNLFIVYIGFYFCRSNLTVASPVLKDEGIDKERIGLIISIGTAAYMMGKWIGSPIIDFVGGRHVILLACAGSVIATIIFALIGPLSFSFMILAWAFNRLAQSLGWPSIMKQTVLWFEESTHGKVLSGLSVSYMLGDVLSRLVLGALLGAGVSWQGLFYVGASVLFIIFLISLYFLKKDPQSIGEEEVAAGSVNLYGEGAENNPTSIKDLYLPLLKSFPVYLLITTSIGLTFIREVMRDWIPIYLQESAGLDPYTASLASATEPAAGIVSTLLLGYLMDKPWGKKRRALILIFFLLLLIASLIVLWIQNSLDSNVSLFTSILFLSLIGFSLTGPYAITAVFSAELVFSKVNWLIKKGGKKGSATLSGLTDAMGYLGSIFSGVSTGTIADKYGWGIVFALLSIFALLTLGSMSVYYWYVELRKHTYKHVPLRETELEDLPSTSEQTDL